MTKKLFKNKKKDCFKKFAESINFHTSQTFVWNKCKIFKNNWVNIKPQHSSENLQTQNKNETALDKLSPPWAQTDPDWLPRCEDNTFFDSHFDFVEFNIALSDKNIKSSPGMDGINFEIIKKLPAQHKLLLLDIFNNLYLTKNYPQSWKKCFVMFINKSDGKNVRPIALTSCLCKLFETLLKNRLQWWVEFKGLLPDSQSGFRKGKSCHDNTVNLTLKVDEAFKERKEVLAAFLDVKGAFDHVNIDILLSKLVSIGCSIHVLKFIKFINHDRQVYTESSTTNFRTVHKGVAQGAVLSPLLYILYVSSITDNVPKSVCISQFADDIAVYIKFRSLARGKGLLIKAISTMAKNLSSLGLEFEPSKTILIHFNKNKSLPGNTEITINNLTIKSSESVRFLGIFFDYKLSFTVHVDYVKKKCMRALNIIKFLCCTWWGSDPSTLTILYKSCVRSLIDYGCFIYSPSSVNLINKLERIQYTAIRSVLGLRISTPTNILLAEAKLLSIKDRTELLCYSYLAKVMSNLNSTTFKCITSFHNIVKKRTLIRNSLISRCISNFINSNHNIDSHGNYNIYCHDYKTVITSLPIDTSLGRDLKNSNDPNALLTDYLNNTNALVLFTDGSKITNANFVGSSCLCPSLHFHVENSINPMASVFTAECIALNDALEFALQFNNVDIFILSDSLSALTSLQSNKKSVKTNNYILEIKKKYNQFLSKNPTNHLKLFWIPSHTGIAGNEEADRLAKLATESTKADIVKVPFTDLFEKFRRDAFAQTNRSVIEDSLTKGKIYFNLFHNDARTPWFSKRRLCRETIVTICRCRANH